MLPYLVCEFSKPTVSNLVKECFGSDFPDIFDKPQLNYLYRYLNDLCANSVILEREYLDKDYLEDYLKYYAKCFRNKGPKCARLHFFSIYVDHSVLNDVLAHGPQSRYYRPLCDSYLGFIVVKPLPMTFIGKTCLKHYPKINQLSTKKVCITRKYDVDMFGVKLSVDTVAFQEQDKVVSACATTAIWVALHASSWSNEKQIPACSEITGNALNHIVGSNNSFPNKGLTNKQILRALDIAGLRYYNEALDENALTHDFFDTVKCHIDSDIPLLLGAKIKTCSGKDLGRHAVTIIGYSIENGEQTLYIHDDRLGPFARASFRCIGDVNGLVLQQKDDLGNWQDPQEILIPISLIIPTNKKARIPYVLPRNTCKLIVQEFRNMLVGISKDAVFAFDQAVNFSLRLAQISDVRQSLIEQQFEDKSPQALAKKVSFLVGSYARFQWVASFTFQDRPAFKLLFDATDIPQGNAISGLFVEDEKSADLILAVIKKVAKHHIQPNIKENENFFGALIRFLRPDKPGLAEHLDSKYGELRAPRYVKEAEIILGNINDNESVTVYYDAIDKSLDEIYGDITKLLWAISEDGAVLIGKELEGQGHPSLTGFKPARISGELNKTTDGKWIVNDKSGRYSRDYENSKRYLENGVKRIKTFFPKSCDLIYQE